MWKTDIQTGSRSEGWGLTVGVAEGSLDAYSSLADGRKICRQRFGNDGDRSGVFCNSEVHLGLERS